jgi:drug/metabolite transporter (DMT)-like permease
MTAVLALLSSLIWGGADFLGGTLSMRVKALAVVGGSQALALVLIVPTAFLVGATGDPTGYLPWGIAAGLVGMGSLVAFYAALAAGTMGVVAPIAATGVIVPVVIGLVQGDRPASLQMLGVVLAVAGVVLASGPEIRAAQPVDGQPPEGAGGVRALVLAMIAAAGFGLVLWLIAKGAHYSVAMTLLTQRTASVTVALVILLFARKLGGLTVRDIPQLAVIGAGDASANGLFAIASRSGLISLVAVLGSLYPVVTVVLARVVHGERMRTIQNVGVVAALGGVVMIAAGGL